MVRDRLRLLAHVADRAPVHEALIGVVAILIYLLSVVRFQLCVFHVLELFLLSAVVSVVNFACWFLGHFAALVPVVNVFHVCNPVRLEVIFFVLHDEYVVLRRHYVGGVRNGVVELVQLLLVVNVLSLLQLQDILDLRLEFLLLLDLLLLFGSFL